MLAVPARRVPAAIIVKRRREDRPLRRILRVVNVELVPGVVVQKEELECGHVMAVKQDIYGPTNALARRCRMCTKPTKE